MKIKENLFPPSLFAIYLGVLLLMSGIHTGLIVFMNKVLMTELVQVIVPMVYWGMVAVGLTLFTRKKMKNTYEEPLHKMAEATRKVSEGDFSQYVPTVHTADKLDYLDIMIMDFNKMVEELGSIETLKTDFISNVSHEIKTPLSVIQSNAELLRKKRLAEEERIRYTETILQATKRLSDLITNMLKLNKLEKQAIQPIPQVYDVCTQLCECALQFEDIWEEKGIDFIADIEDRAMIRADAGLLELVWNNLLSNALKFTEMGGQVKLTQTSEADTVFITVTDTGCGMADETMKHIFDKFYQGDTSHSTEGNGLGLALVKRILELSDGEISVKSRQGEGTAFTVTVPVGDVSSLQEGEFI